MNEEGLRKELGEAMELKNSIQTMTNSAGWKLYVELLTRQETMRMEQILQPPGEEVTADSKNFLTGEVSGIRVCRGILDMLHDTADDMAETLRAELQTLEEEKEDGEEEEEFGSGI